MAIDMNTIIQSSSSEKNSKIKLQSELIHNSPQLVKENHKVHLEKELKKLYF